MPNDAEVDDVKKAVARQVGIKDHNRIGLFYPSTRKRIADRRASVRSLEDVTSTGRILVQDLGTYYHLFSSFQLEAISLEVETNI